MTIPDPNSPLRTAVEIAPDAGSDECARLFGVFQNCSVEIEFKFYGDAAALDGLAQSTWINAFGAESATRRQLVTEYYDTPDHALQKAGYRLRLRTGGAKRSLSAKKRISASDGLFRRLEWKLRVAEGQGVHDVISENHDMSRLGIHPRDLRPVFTTHIGRETRKLAIEANGATAHILMAIDLGFVATRDAQVQISETELELLDGPLDALVPFAEEVRKRFQLTPGTLSKADRGYGLLLAGN